MSGQPTPVGVAALEPDLRPLIAALIAFLLAGAAAVVVVRQSEQYRLHEQRTHLADLVGKHADAIQASTQRALSVTYALAALVRQGQGSIANFDAIASELLRYYPGAASLQLAPGGIVQQIVPLAGNEKAIGHNLLQDPTRNKEAFLARDSGQLTLAGPFQLMQGGLGAVGRLPVFLDDSQGKLSFWGFTTVLIRYPQALEAARLAQLTKQGFGYELWRIHPDSGQKQSIAASSSAALIDPVARTLGMPNGSWTLSVAPLKGWNEPLWLTLKSALGLLFSLLLGYLAKVLFESRAHERHLETLVQRRTAEISATQAKLQATFDAIPDMVWLKNAQGVYLDCNPMYERFLGAKKAAILGKTAYDFLDPEQEDSFRELDRQGIAPGQVWLKNAQGVYLDCNPMYERFSGAKKAATLGKTAHGFVEPEQVDSFREHDRQAIASGQPTVNEQWLTFAADGRRGLFEITRTVMRDGDGQLAGILGIAHDISEHKALAAAMAESHQRVEERTRDLASTNVNLNREMAERRSLEIELIRVSEEQRRVIGCELHDGLGQHLTSLSLLSASLQQQLTNRAQPEANAARRIGELIDEATSMTRSVASGLYPVALEYAGLTAALEQLTDHARSLHKMDCVLDVGPEVQVHDPLVAINLYRIAQEAITNALKYSQAGLMRINLAQVDGKVRLTLSDDGIGIDPSRLGSAKGLGMHSMHYRASLLGGDMQVQSNAQHGTTITVTYPDDRRSGGSE